MLFNSFSFFVFFCVFYAIYLGFRKSHKFQNRALLLASYVFYGWWDWRFLSLLWLSTVVDFFCGLGIARTGQVVRRRTFLVFSICFNLGILFYFKYANFFIDSWIGLFQCFGWTPHFSTLQIILPVGVSFYTFQEIGYIVAVYKKKVKPVQNILDYALFVSYFPQLMAGPINRAESLLPQILTPRKISLESFYEGCYLIFWGLYKKIFIADNLARIVTSIFGAEAPYNGFQVLLGCYAFTFQIYCDFSGYSDIARGLSKAMGFNLMQNFNLPYFSTSPGEFWRRWHISLSEWLRDHIYIPLGGNRKGQLQMYRNLLLTMILGGLWHGANWTYVAWGAYHGILLCVYKFLEGIASKLPEVRTVFFKKTWFFFRVIFFFHLTCLGWLLFRAESFSQFSEMLKALFTNLDIVAGLTSPSGFRSFVFFTVLLIIIQCVQYAKKDLMFFYKTNFHLRAGLYTTLFYLMFLYGAKIKNEFIYFQF